MLNTASGFEFTVTLGARKQWVRGQKTTANK